MLWTPPTGSTITLDDARFAMRTRGALSVAPWMWDGLLCWYPFLEGGGLGCYDFSGNANHGTFNGMATSDWVHTPKGASIDLDGSDDQITIARPSVLNASRQLTVVYTFYPRSQTLDVGYWGREASGDGANRLSMTPTTGAGGTGDVALIFGNGSSTFGYTNTDWMSMNTWYHAAAVFDGSASSNADRLKLYVDGNEHSLTYSGTIPSTLHSAAYEFRIGGNASGFNQSQIVSDVRLYSRALTASQVATMSADPDAIARRRPSDIGLAAAAAAAGFPFQWYYQGMI